MRTLQRAHPLCCFAFILAVFAVTIFTRSPVLLGISALGAAMLLILTERGRLALWMPLIVALSAITNPIFSHNGTTVLFFAGDLPITLEAILYGADFGLLLAASLGWSVAAVRFITSDKYIWLFGRILPTAGLVLSCALRLVPLFISRGKNFAAAQGAVTLQGNLKAFSASVGYSSEEAMMTADSMRARGYGTARRTSYSLYRLHTRELLQLSAIMILGVSSVVLVLSGKGSFDFFPIVTPLPTGVLDTVLYCAFSLLALLPSAAVITENIKRLHCISAVKKGGVK